MDVPIVDVRKTNAALAREILSAVFLHQQKILGACGEAGR
jgi:hypothetical protein